MNTPLVNKEYLLQKFPGKGGWTFAEIPEILQDKHSPFGWVKVKGSIDGFQIQNYRLQAMGNGKLFLPVKAEIRKAIKKQAGDVVVVILYRDDSSPEIPEELLICLKDEPGVYASFEQLIESEQNKLIDWIKSAKKTETKVKRINAIIDQLIQGKKVLNTCNSK